MKIDLANWKKNKIALSNDVYVNEEKELIYKKYKQNEFNRIYGNQEKEILKYVKDFKIYPSDDESLIINYYHAKNFVSKMLDDNPNLIAKIADKIKEIHNIDLKEIKKVTAPNFAGTWEWISTIQEIPKLDNEDFYFQEAMKLLSKDSVVANNDIVDGNILLFNDKIIILDFEYGGLNNRMFDLAAFIVKRQISPEIEELFLSSYYKNQKFNKEEFFAIRKFVAYFWSKWAYYKFILSKEDVYLDIFNWLSKR